MSNQLLPDISQGQWDAYQSDQFQERTAGDLDRISWHQSTTQALENIVPPPPLPPEPAPAEVPEAPPAALQRPAPARVAPPPPPAAVPATPVPDDFPPYGAPAAAPLIPAYQPNASEALSDGGALPSLPAAAPATSAAPALTGNAWLDRVGGMLAAIPSTVTSAAGEVAQAAIGSLNAGGEALQDFTQGAQAGNLQQRGIDALRSDDGPLAGSRRSVEEQNAGNWAAIDASNVAIARRLPANADKTDAQLAAEGRYGLQLGEGAAAGIENVGLKGVGPVLSRSKQIERSVRAGKSLEEAIAHAEFGAPNPELLDAAGNALRRPAAGAGSGSGLLGPTGRALPRTPSVAAVVPDIAPEVAPVVQRVVDTAVATVPPARATIVDRVLSFTLGNLFSAGTVGVNTVGNVVAGLERPAVELFSGHPVVAGADVAAMAGAVPRAVAKAARAFLRGDAALGEGAAPDVAAQIGRPEAFPGISGAIATPIARVNRGIDEFFRTLATAGATAVARVTGMPEAEAIPFISQAADTGVLTGSPSRITAFISSLGQKSEGHPAADLAFRVAATTWFPFVRIPEEVFKRTVQIVTNPAVQPWKMIQANRIGDAAAQEQAAAKMLMSLSLYWGVWHAVHGGTIRGTSTGTAQEDALGRGAMDAQGNPILQPGETKVAGRTVPTGLAGQWGNAATLIASAIEGWEQPGKPGKPPPEVTERLANAFDQLGKATARQYYLDNFVETMHQISQGNLVPEAQKLGTGLATRNVPAWLTQLNQGADPVVREPTNALEAIEARLPGLSQRVQPKIDPTTGEPVRRSGDLLTFLFRSGAPGTPNPVAGEVTRLEATGNPVAVRQFGKTVDYAGAIQTPEQRRVLQGAFGKATQTYIADVLARPEYQAASDAQKAATLNKALETAYKVADLKAGERIGRDPAHQAALAYASIPHYVGVKGTVEEIRQGNLEHANARAEYQRYVTEYGKDRAELELLRRDKETWRLLQHPAIDSELLKIRKKRIDEQFAVAAGPDTGALRGAALPVRVPAAAGAGR